MPSHRRPTGVRSGRRHAGSAFYKGEEIDRSRDLSFHLGIRRLGFAVSLSLTKQSVLDYSEEQNQ
jgi:hypothetical protein